MRRRPQKKPPHHTKQKHAEALYPQPQPKAQRLEPPPMQGQEEEGREKEKEKEGELAPYSLEQLQHHHQPQ